MPVLGLPLALAALAGLPVLAGIYWLRSRSRRQVVSSLYLWSLQRASRAGGRRIERFQVPLLLVLELLALLMFALAAADPRVRSPESRRPLAVVLDDSFSMLAGGDDSARARALTQLAKELDKNIHYPVALVLAGRTPTAIGTSLRARGEIDQALARWACRSAAADLDRGIALAGALLGERGRILVLTDRAPPQPPEPGRLEWWSFGQPLGNVAVINAARASRQGADRGLLEVANYGASPAQARLKLENARLADGGGQEVVLSLPPGQTRRMILLPDSPEKPIRAELAADALDLDNRTILLPSGAKAVRVQLAVGRPEVKTIFAKALAATALAEFVTERPELLITDLSAASQPAPGGAGGECWTLRLIAEEDAAAYVGPFVLDRTHPLCEGLALESVVWAAGKSQALAGLPVLSAGNVVLLADEPRPGGRHELRLRLRPDLSTLQDTPNWPILAWNLLHWRSRQTAGCDQANARLGGQVTLTLPPARANVQVFTPDGASRSHEARAAITVPAEQVGMYTIRAGGEDYRFAVNALCPDESDLRPCESGRWGEWVTPQALQEEFNSIAWVFLLVGLAALAAHLAILARRKAVGE